MTAITLWGRPCAFNVQKVLWFADELGLDYDHIKVGGQYGGLDDPDFRALSPHGKVPVLVDGQTIVWESHAILRYLAAAYGAKAFWSPDPVVRVHIDGWIDWMQAALQPDFMQLFWGFYRMPEVERDMHAINAARAACDARFRLLIAHQGSNAYLAGDRFSLVDIPAGTTLYRYFEMGADVVRYPAVDDWYQRLATRVAFRRRIMTDFRELRGRATF